MSVLKRLCLLVFSLCGAFSLAALTLPWLGPWTREATALLSVQWYYIALEVTIGVTGVGLLVALLCALFARKRKVVEIGRPAGDSITVTCAAISSQTVHGIERSGPYAVERVRVRARKHSVRIAARVRPHYDVSVSSEGARLHDVVMGGLSALVGADAVEGVDLEFVEPVASGDAASVAAYAGPLPSETDDAVVPNEPERGMTDGADRPDEITVPMGHADVSPDAEPEPAQPAAVAAHDGEGE